jgi:hypothetical protein
MCTKGWALQGKKGTALSDFCCHHCHCMGDCWEGLSECNMPTVRLLTRAACDPGTVSCTPLPPL